MRHSNRLAGTALALVQTAGLAEPPLVPETVASGLEIPWALDFAPDGRIFLTERPGRIRVIEDGVLRAAPWSTLDVANWRAGGLAGIALDPHFADNGHVFVVGTFRLADDGFENRIYRFTERDGRGTDRTLIVGDLPSVDTHAGGALAFGPDAKLFLSVGDGENIAAVQDLVSTLGKILRYNADGTIPADNPIAGSPVYASGLRNPQGFSWHPQTGQLFATEHGPSGFTAEGGRRDQDELNLIVPGGNYGWPEVSGLVEDPRYLPPLAEWTPAIAPAGLAFIADRDSAWYGRLLVGALRGQQLLSIRLEPASQTASGWSVTEQTPLLRNKLGRIRAVRYGPDGHVYFTTSNRNTPGEPTRDLARDGDDRLYRLRIDRERG